MRQRAHTRQREVDHLGKGNISPVRRAGRCTPFPKEPYAPVAGTKPGVPCACVQRVKCDSGAAGVPCSQAPRSPMLRRRVPVSRVPRRPFVGHGTAAEEPPTPETPAAATPRLAVWSLLLKGTMGHANLLILLGLRGTHGSPLMRTLFAYRTVRSSAENVSLGALMF